MMRADAGTHGTASADVMSAARRICVLAPARPYRGPHDLDVQVLPVTAEFPRPHRPALFSDLTEMIDAAGGASPDSRAEIAAATAAVLVQAGRSPGDGARFVDLADRVGLDTLGALWRDAEPVSLPGALWALYLLRQWCHADADEVTRMWRAGEPLAPAEAAVAGVRDLADADALRALPDAVLAGVYQGDLAVALERGAAFFRVVAAGRRAVATSDDPAAMADAENWAQRNERAAAALSSAAGLWRAGALH